MKLILAAFALALFMEGFAFALFPEFMRKQFLELGSRMTSEIRFIGICALSLAIVISILSRFIDKSF